MYPLALSIRRFRIPSSVKVPNSTSEFLYCFIAQTVRSLETCLLRKAEHMFLSFCIAHNVLFADFFKFKCITRYWGQQTRLHSYETIITGPQITCYKYIWFSKSMEYSFWETNSRPNRQKKSFPPFVQPWDSLLWPQELPAGRYHEPTKSSLHRNTSFPFVKEMAKLSLCLKLSITPWRRMGRWGIPPPFLN
jgi:hypothetical protein